MFIYKDGPRMKTAGDFYYLYTYFIQFMHYIQLAFLQKG